MAIRVNDGCMVTEENSIVDVDSALHGASLAIRLTDGEWNKLSTPWIMALAVKVMGKKDKSRNIRELSQTRMKKK